MERTIEIARHEPTEMAYILLDGESVFTGNEWDFHAGCMGTIIAGYDLEGKWDKGVESLAYVLSVELEREGHTVTRTKKALSDYDNDVLMSGVEYADKVAAGDDGDDEPDVIECFPMVPPPARVEDQPLQLDEAQIEAVGERYCELCGEAIPAADWCVACSDAHDESHCPSCCKHGAAIQRRSLIEWLRGYKLWPAV